MTAHLRVFIAGCVSSLWFVLPAPAAEMRSWKASSGHSVEAQFVELRANNVHMKTKDGRDIDVPLDRLSTADQEYVRKQTAAGSKEASPALAAIQKQADRCRTPQEAVALFQIFRDDPKTSDVDRRTAEAKIAEFQQLVAENKVRLNKKWVSAEEAEAARKKADELMRQGLALLKIDQEDAFRQKFKEAAALESDEIRADFIAGIICMARRQADKALPYFQKCILRSPDNVAVLNNVALLAAAKGDWTVMTGNWGKAMKLQPDQRVVHNVGRFLEQAAAANVHIPKSATDPLALPYAELIAAGKCSPTDRELGWLVMLIEDSDLDIDLKDEEESAEEKRAAPTPADNSEGTVVGGGTGFVVHPGYVLTNAHVAQDNSSFEIQLTDGTLLKATRTAYSKKDDLALLKCEELTAPPLTLAPALVPRGTDVMLLGYPEMMNLGASLKATRGSISALPDPKAGDRYLYDAVTNAGNSGGPVCDDKGNVVAVHYLGINTASRYGGGIPSPKAISFLQANLPGYAPPEPRTEKRDWPQVDEQVSPSTMLIWVRQKGASAKQAPGSSDYIELPLCLFCGGAGKLRCMTNGCLNGRVLRNNVRVECPTCGGKGLIPCQVCKGVGLDVKLAAVKQALSNAAKAKASAPPPNRTPPMVRPGGPPPPRR